MSATGMTTPGWRKEMSSIKRDLSDARIYVQIHTFTMGPEIWFLTLRIFTVTIIFLAHAEVITWVTFLLLLVFIKSVLIDGKQCVFRADKKE